VVVVYQQGVIIMARQVPDQNGVNPKDRPVLLLIPFHDTDTDACGVAITSTYPHPPPSTAILLPYQRQGKCQTDLINPSVAVCDWPVVVGKADILGKLGICPPIPLAAILAQLPKLQPIPPFQHTPNATGSSGSQGPCENPGCLYLVGWGSRHPGKDTSKRKEGETVMSRNPLARPAAGPLGFRTRAARFAATRPINHPLPPVLRLDWVAAAAGVAVAEPVAGSRDAVLALIEAVLFAADEPLVPRRLAAVANLSDAAEARRQVRRLQMLYEEEGSAFQIEEVAGGFQLLTRPEFHPWLARLRRGVGDLKLTPGQRDTLTMVAYRQPVTRADVEGIRGVQSGEVLRQLLERGLIRVAGRDESLGRPVLYGTTKKFLQAFGLNSLRDLPRIEERKGGGEAAREKPSGNREEEERT
jgi:segregation and condensation protein B